eukprot:TRINITY_DN8013_c0_g2_i2.p1 TRINITY_DN8013_c0_g2~~TRINITY_DN8013_c0_g2_i2.p1  ORF type:complete len:259 (+),score=138.27 TRINITY_DN8013_c0_g2_i2:257-1033(+)
MMGDSKELEDRVLLVDVLSLSLGIETIGGVMTKLLERNTAIPAKQEKVFSTTQDDQTHVQIQVFEGERAMTKDNRQLGSFTLSGIPPAARGVPQIEVVFSVDENGLLEVSASDKAAGVKEQITIAKDRGALTEEEIARMVKEAEDYEEEDKKARERVEARNALEAATYDFKTQITDEEKLASVISEEDRTLVEDAIQDVNAWLDENPDSVKEDFEEKLKDLKDVADPIIARAKEAKKGDDAPASDDADDDDDDDEDDL